MELHEIIKQVEKLFDEKQYEKVLEVLNDEMLEQHASGYLYAWRARAHYRLRDFDGVFKYASKGIEVDPKSAFAYLQRGLYWYTKERYDEAIADYTKAVDLEKTYSQAFYNRSLAWGKKAEYDQAIEDCDKAIELENNYPDAYVNRGLVWYYKGDYDKAIADYSKAIDLKKDYSLAYNNRAFAWSMKGDPEQAIADYSKAIKYDPESPLAFRNRGDLYYELEDFQKAINDYEMARQLDPETYSYLEDRIKLSIEKLEQLKKLEETNAKPDDKTEKTRIDKIIDDIINTIRQAARSEVKTVVHYTKVFVVDLYVKNLEAKMHYSNAIYMNDPMEGKMLFEYLDDKTIEEAYLNGEKRTETSVYLGSFLPAEENDGEISHEDELVMWRTYGKDELGKEAAGSCVILSSDFFKLTIASKEPQATKDHLEGELLNVVYIKKSKSKKEIVNDTDKKISLAIDKLKKQLLKLIKLRDNYSRTDEFYREIENTIFKKLSTVTYLFKSADYEFENEVRVITYMPRNSDTIKGRPINEGANKPPKRFYIESYNHILPYIKKIYLGPKVEHYQEWSLYLDYELRQRAKELEASPSPLFRLKPSDIEIMKSQCKFQ